MCSRVRARHGGSIALACLAGLVWLETAPAQLPIPGGRYPTTPGDPRYPRDPRDPRPDPSETGKPRDPRVPQPGEPYPRRGRTSDPFPRVGRVPGPSSDVHTIRTLVGECDEITKEQLTITTRGHREFRLKLTDKTEFLRDAEAIERSEIQKGDTVRVTAKQDDKGFLTASRVQLDMNEGPAHLGATIVSKAPDLQVDVPGDPDDPGPPKLRRRTPEEIERLKNEKAERQANEVELAKYQPPPKPHMPKPAPEPRRDPHIEKARAQALKFTENLPNFICRQIVARYQSLATSPPDWQAQDVVEADLVFFDGQEDYQNIKVGYKLVKKKMDELDGTWSTGEYGTVLRNLFEPGTLAEFRFRGLQMTSGRVGRRYDFRVERSRSNWEARAASDSYMPAYKGSISIDQKTHRTLRIEMEAMHLPPDFAISSLEMTVEYGLVLIGSQYCLLPVHSENIGCFRYSSRCTLNKIDFRNYRKFTSESTVFTSDSDVSFDGEEVRQETGRK